MVIIHVEISEPRVFSDMLGAGLVWSCGVRMGMGMCWCTYS